MTYFFATIMAMNSIIFWLKRNEKLTLGLLIVFFLFVRLSGVHLPLHQDEYKWPLISNPATANGVSIPHPPLSEFIYRTAGYIVGFNVNFRFVPLLFGTINLLLLYYFVRERFGKKEALAVSTIWIFSYFSVLASLMVDTDGEIMPFFFLLALIAYYKTQENTARKKWWIALLVLSCVGGFFIKVSFLLAVVALVADFLWSKKGSLNKKIILKYIGFGIAGVVGCVLLLIIAHLVFPFFNLATSVAYWEHFANFHRDILQTMIQCVKALLYSSPFLVFIPFLSRTDDVGKVKPLIFFLICAFLFYIVIFDFSLGALDRYLQLVVLPLSVLSGVAIVSVLKNTQRFKEVTREKLQTFFFLSCIFSVLLLLTQFTPHYAPPLQPKAEWISRVLSLRWNFVYPFSGGSGPLGFYVSFLYIALTWIISFVLLIWALFKPTLRAPLLVCILVLGGLYNLVFIEEYLFGFVNGYAATLLSHAVEYIKNNPDIQKVTVYNDNGGNEIQQIGKYRKRLYIDPKFDQSVKLASLNQYKEHYFVLNIPQIDQHSFYQKYFNSCKIIYKEVDQQISATVYDCRNAPDVIK